jgi:hypothetical protein
MERMLNSVDPTVAATAPVATAPPVLAEQWQILRVSVECMFQATSRSSTHLLFNAGAQSLPDGARHAANAS